MNADKITLQFTLSQHDELVHFMVIFVGGNALFFICDNGKYDTNMLKINLLYK